MKTKPVVCWVDTFFSGVVLICTAQNAGSSGLTPRGVSSPLDRTITCIQLQANWSYFCCEYESEIMGATVSNSLSLFSFWKKEGNRRVRIEFSRKI